MSDERPLTDVAVGIVFDRDGRVLLGQRPAGKPYAGWWEFPGGKLEPGESVADALARELHEELGIRVLSSRPWIVREHSYPHARVRLHFRQVFHWRGEPVAREGQAFGWTRPDAIAHEPLLPATVPILGMLALPRRMKGLATGAFAIRPASGSLPIWAGEAPQARPRILFVLDAAGSAADARCGSADAAAGLGGSLRRLRAVRGAVVCAAGDWPAALLAACDGIVAGPAELPARDAAPQGLRGLRIAHSGQLPAITEVDADFAVIAFDVNEHSREIEHALAFAPMPVYLRVSPSLNRGIHPAGLQGTASGYWRTQ